MTKSLTFTVYCIYNMEDNTEGNDKFETSALPKLSFAHVTGLRSSADQVIEYQMLIAQNITEITHFI